MPSDAQKEAGNYAMDRLRLHGLPITIENRKGTIRRGTSKSGHEWSVVLPYHYGYIRRTLSADGDQVDCFIGPNSNSQFVVIVNQHDKQTGVFDEVKVGLGYLGLEQAKAAYRQAYRGGHVPRAEFTTTTVQRLKEWLKIKQTWAKFDLQANMKTVDFGSALRERVSVKSTSNGMHRLKFNGRNIGHMTTQANGVIRNVAIDDKFKGLGLGKKLYGDVMRRMPNKTLVSGWATSDDAHRVWRGMAKRKGYSVSQTGNGPYVGKLAFSRSGYQLTTLANPMKRVVQFRQSTPKVEEKPSLARKVAAGVGAAAVVGGFYKYASTRPDVKKHAYRMQRAKVASDPTRSNRMKTTAYTQDLKKQPAPRHTPAYDGGAGFNYGVNPTPTQPAAVKTEVRGGSLLKRKVLDDKPQTPADRRAAKIKAGWKQVNQTTALRARVLLTQFQDRNDDGTLGVSTSPLTAYRKASRVVPWVGRAHQTAGDLGDMATGKEVKDPFYKKTWFKRAATTAAIGVPLLAANLARSGERKQADGRRPSTGTRTADKMDRLTHSAADGKRKLYNKLGLSARIKNPILLQAVVTHLKNFDYTDRNDWDLRDARGKSARVFAPGSKPRDRREKNWNEKTENIRLVRNIAIAGTLAGAGAALHYRNKATKLTPGIPKAGTMGPNVESHDFRKPKMASAKVTTVNFSKGKSSLDRLVDATSKNVSLPDRPDLPGEGAVKFVYGLPPKKRAGVLKILGAGALAGGGVAAGVLTKRPKTGAALGGLGAGLLLG